MIVSVSKSAAAKLKEWLPPDTEAVVVDSIARAKECLAQDDFELLIVNAPLADGDGEALCAQAETGAVLLVAQAAYEAVCARLESRGVLVLPKPLSPVLFRQGLSLLRASRAKVTRLQSKLSEVRVVERAKWALIQTLQMTEAQAHRYIEKQAMDRRISKAEVAEHIIRTYEF